MVAHITLKRTIPVFVSYSIDINMQQWIKYLVPHTLIFLGVETL
jgi:hypothetical protein